MALNGYVLNVHFLEMMSLQRWCANRLNQVALYMNTYGGIYHNEIKALQQDYADFWKPLFALLFKWICLPHLCFYSNE